MKLEINDIQDKHIWYQMPLATRFKYFFTMKKRRFFYMFMMYLVWKYYERVINYFRTKR